MYSLDAFKKLHVENVRVVDVRSDTVSIPTPEMRKAMAEAAVGDDVYGEDPTINALEQESAKMFGKEAGLFTPSGTMANLLAIMVHCHCRGTEAIVGSLSHTFLYEQGGAAHIAGVQLNTIKNNPDGTFCLNEFESKIRGSDFHEPITKLCVIENTHNMCGGKVIPLEWISKLNKICKSHNITMHMDGARVFNASEALGVPVSTVVKDFDSVCYCLSKGLSAPVGSVLLGSSEFIDEARRLRKALGGAMRQAGILAAAGLVALETVIPKLSQDHKRIYQIAEAIDKLKSPNIKVHLEGVQTNILLIEMVKPEKISARHLQEQLASVMEEEIAKGITSCDEKGIIVKISSRDWSFARIVIYHQITDEDVDLIIKKFNYVIPLLDGKYV